MLAGLAFWTDVLITGRDLTNERRLVANLVAEH